MNTPIGSFLQPFLQRAGCLSRLALACLAAPLAAAGELPTGFKPVSGSITQDLGTPGALNLQQNSERAIVNWNSFSIGQDNAVNISQPGRSSMLLNRVQGGLPSEIAGRLTANGRVFLVNPNGVLFGSGAQVSTGGLVASTLDIADDDFNAGRLKFSRADGNQAAVINRGALQAGPGGTVALLGAVVRNEGTIKADGGTAALVSARQLSLDFEGDGLTTFRIDADKPASQALVENAASGVVQADGGRVAILADPATAAQLVVNQQGVLRARSLEQRAGEIVLGVGADDRAEVAGRLDASGGPGLQGGTVTIGGGGLYLNERAEVDAGGGAGGGRIEVRASRSAALAAGSRLNADARDNGKGGTLNLQGGDSLRAHGSLQARGAGQGAGGFVETSARALDLTGVQVDTAGAPGQPAGSWLIDPFNITVLPCCDTGESSDPVLDSPFDPVVADSIVFDSAISAALDAGSNVRIHTGPAAAGEIGGDIVIGDGVSILRQEATGGALELRFDANQSISGGFFSIASTAAPLNLVFNANANGFRPEAGFIRFVGNVEVASSLRTQGGSVHFIGQSDPDNGTASNAFGSGILIDGMEIDTRDATLGGSGAVVMRGRADVSFSSEDAPDAGVKLQNARIDAADGRVLVQGRVAGTGSFGLYGALVGQSEIATRGGAIEFDGTALSGGNGGLQLTGSSLLSQAGNIRLAGQGQASDFGLAIFQSTLSTSAGSFELDGATDAGTVGAVVSASQIGSGSGDTLIRGRTGSGQFGLLLASSDVGADSGDLTLIGLAGQADAAPAARIGLAVAGSSLVAGQGNIDLRGRVAAASETDGSSSAGLLFGFGEIGSGEVRAEAGSVSLAGEAAEGSSVAGLRFVDSGASVFAGNELLIRAASSDPAQPALDVAAASALGGAALVNLRPGGVAADGSLTDHFATPIQIGADPVEGGLSVSNFLIDQTLIDRLSPTPRLALGSDGQAGSIVVVGSPSFAESTLGELTLQAEGSGGAIDLRAPLSLPGGGLALLADGPLTQQDGAPLTAARLVASSRSDSVQLAAANGVGALAGRAAGAFRFRNAVGDLRLAELTFTAMSGEVGGERSQAGVQAGTILALNAEGGNLTQDSPASLAAASLLATSSSGVLLDNPDNETG
ncbi:filamentous hemagglutinin family N-terminal domain-containing protein, partial [Azotobacter beijerinckii]